eukprot:m.19248 g.19248  ORF g.19248 m.19248 type:complete len:170 (-) comp12197_c0_seq1:673-1182(-)
MLSESFGVGMARIQIHTHCGNMLAKQPYTFITGFFSDLTFDDKLDLYDVFVFYRQFIPLAHVDFRRSLLIKLDSDITSYKSGEKTPRITFRDTLPYIQAFANMTNNFPITVYLVGWQGTGHDTLYQSLNILNAKLGDTADIQWLSQEAAKVNATISYHINTDEAYWELH